MAKWHTITWDMDTAYTAFFGGWYGSAGFTVTGNRFGMTTSDYRGATKYDHDLTESHVIVKVEADTSGGYNGFELYEGSTERAHMYYLAGALECRIGTSTTSHSLNPATEVWWRCREASGVLYLEASTDGNTWVTKKSAAHAFNLTSCEFSLTVGAHPSAGSGTCWFSKWNLPPAPATVALDGTAGGTSTATAELSVAQALTGRSAGDDGGNKAIYLDGAGAFARYTLAAPASATDMTVCCWFKPAATTASQAVMAFNTGVGGNAPEVFWRNNGDRFTLHYTSPDTFVHEPSITRPLHEWCHLCLEITAAGVVTLYVNGVQVQQATGIAAINNPLTGYTLSFGQEYDGASVSNLTTGWVDEGLLFHRVLTAGERASLANRLQGESVYAAAVAAMSPYAWWRMADASGTTMADASGNGRTGTYIGNPWLDQAGAVLLGPATTLDAGTGLGGTSTGASTANGELGLAFTVDGTSGGSSDSAGSIEIPLPLAGTSGGISTATGDLTYLIGLDGSAAGAAGTTAALVAGLAMAGTADGVAGTPAPQLDRAPGLAGTAAGATTTSTPTLTVVRGPMELVAAPAVRRWEAQTAPPRTVAHRNARRSYEVAT